MGVAIRALRNFDGSVRKDYASRELRTWSSRQVDQQYHEQKELDERALQVLYFRTCHVGEGIVGNYAESQEEQSQWQPSQPPEGLLPCIEQIYPGFEISGKRIGTNNLRTSFFITFPTTSQAPRYVPGGEHCIRVLTVSKL